MAARIKPAKTEPEMPLFIGVGMIDPHPENPRQDFPADELQALAGSLVDLTMLAPLQVEAAGSRFRILSGERRWRAAKLAGWPQVPCYVRKLPPNKAILLLAEDNLQHRELNPIERARAVSLMVKPASEGGAGMTYGDVAKRYGKDESWVSNLVRLLRLPAALQEETRAGSLCFRQARALVPYAAKPEVLAAVAADRAANPNDWRGAEQFEAQLTAVAQRVESFGQRVTAHPDPKGCAMAKRKTAAPAPAAVSKLAKFTTPPAKAAPPPAPTVAQICAAIRELSNLRDVHEITNVAHARASELINKP